MDNPRLPVLLRQLRRLVTAQNGGTRSDQELLQAFVARREEAAFTALVQRHGAMVLSVCRSVLNHQQDAEDVFQATFLVLARKAASIRKQQSLASWLHGVAYRLALKVKAGAGKRAAPPLPAEVPAPCADMDELTWRELRGVLHEEVHRLPEKYRAPLLLCYWDGKTQDEAARQLGWNRATLKDRLERARTLLRGRLARRGLAPSVALFAAMLSRTTATAAVPAMLADTTVKASLLAAEGKVAAAGVISANVLTLTEGMIHAMFATTFKRVAMILVLVLALGTVGASAGVLAWQKQPAGDGSSATQQGVGKDSPVDRSGNFFAPGPDKDAEIARLRKEVKELKDQIEKLHYSMHIAAAQALWAESKAKVSGGEPDKEKGDKKPNIRTVINLPEDSATAEWQYLKSLLKNAKTRKEALLLLENDLLYELVMELQRQLAETEEMAHRKEAMYRAAAEEFNEMLRRANEEVTRLRRELEKLKKAAEK